MYKVSVLPEVIHQYILEYSEMAIILWNKISLSKEIKNTFSEKYLTKYQEEIKNYMASIKLEIKILNYILKNQSDLYLANIFYVLDLMDENYNNRFKYFWRIIENVNEALDTRLEVKFCFPMKNFSYYQEKDFDHFIQLLHGISLESIIYFFEEENILSREQIIEIINQSKIFPNLGDNSIYGVFERESNIPKIIIPPINSEENALIVIHELVHSATLMKHLNLSVQENENLAMFYELLYKERYRFTHFVHENNNAKELLNHYNQLDVEKQVFDEQLKMILKKK